MRPFDLVVFDLYRMGRIKRRRGVGENQKCLDCVAVQSLEGITLQLYLVLDRG
jgi:hypothetical protein